MSEYTAPMEFIDLAAQQKLIRPQLDLAISRVLDHGQYIMGPEVKELEGQLCEFTGANYALTCANGTDALTLVLMARAWSERCRICAIIYVCCNCGELSSWELLLFSWTSGCLQYRPAEFKQAILDSRELGLKPAVVIAVNVWTACGYRSNCKYSLRKYEGSC